LYIELTVLLKVLSRKVLKLWKQ